MAAKKQISVKAKELFSDALTGKTFHPGDEVTGWDEDRARHYEGRGLVTVVEATLKKKDSQMELEEAPKASEEVEEVVENEKGKPGPEVVKEANGKPSPDVTKEIEAPEKANSASKKK